MAPMHLSKTPREDFILKPVAMLCKACVSFKLGYLMRKGSQFEILHSRMHNQRLHGSGEYLNMSHLPAIWSSWTVSTPPWYTRVDCPFFSVPHCQKCHYEWGTKDVGMQCKTFDRIYETDNHSKFFQTCTNQVSSFLLMFLFVQLPILFPFRTYLFFCGGPEISVSSLDDSEMLSSSSLEVTS